MSKLLYRLSQLIKTAWDDDDDDEEEELLSDEDIVDIIDNSSDPKEKKELPLQLPNIKEQLPLNILPPTLPSIKEEPKIEEHKPTLTLLDMLKQQNNAVQENSSSTNHQTQNILQQNNTILQPQQNTDNWVYTDNINTLDQLKKAVFFVCKKYKLNKSEMIYNALLQKCFNKHVQLMLQTAIFNDNFFKTYFMNNDPKSFILKELQNSSEIKHLIEQVVGTKYASNYINLKKDIISLYEQKMKELESRAKTISDNTFNRRIKEYLRANSSSLNFTYFSDHFQQRYDKNGSTFDDEDFADLIKEIQQSIVDKSKNKSPVSNIPFTDPDCLYKFYAFFKNLRKEKDQLKKEKEEFENKYKDKNSDSMDAKAIQELELFKQQLQTRLEKEAKFISRLKRLASSSSVDVNEYLSTPEYAKLKDTIKYKCQTFLNDKKLNKTNLKTSYEKRIRQNPGILKTLETDILNTIEKFMTTNLFNKIKDKINISMDLNYQLIEKMPTENAKNNKFFKDAFDNYIANISDQLISQILPEFINEAKRKDRERILNMF